jgi:hypothetical protein
MTRIPTAMAVLLVGAACAGCSSDDAGAPAVCSSADALRVSVADLGDVQVTENGMASLQDAVASVESDLQQVVDDASSQYGTQVDELKTGFDQVQAAASTALATPSATTVTAVVSSIRSLGTDTASFADQVASTC